MGNKSITCIQCGESFDFTLTEQLRYKKSNFDDPKRCPECRKKKLKQPDEQNGRRNHDKRRYRLQDMD